MTTENEVVLDPRREQELRGAGVAVGEARASQEVQASLVIAQKFPRDEARARRALLAACESKSLAENATYEFPKGDKLVTGPSIRLAEIAARVWRNTTYGWREIESRRGMSTVETWAYDLEANVLVRREFTVPHRRDTRNGSYALTDARDVYEVVSNAAARRVRACILEIIPGELIEEALARCEKTLMGDKGETLDAKIAKMIEAFAAIGVPEAALARRLQHDVKACSVQEVIRLGRVWQSIEDGFAKAEEFFPAERAAAGPAASTAPPSALHGLTERLERGAAPTPAPAQREQIGDPIPPQTHTPPAAPAKRTRKKKADAANGTPDLTPPPAQAAAAPPPPRTSPVERDFFGRPVPTAAQEPVVAPPNTAPTPTPSNATTTAPAAAPGSVESYEQFIVTIKGWAKSELLKEIQRLKAIKNSAAGLSDDEQRRMLSLWDELDARPKV